MAYIRNMNLSNLAKIYVIVFVLSCFTACNSEAPSSNTETSAAPAAETGESIAFVNTQEGKPIIIDAKLFDTDAAKAVQVLNTLRMRRIRGCLKRFGVAPMAVWEQKDWA